MLKRILYALALLSFLTLFGCSPTPPKHEVTVHSEIADFGNGIYVLDYNRNFANDLSAFVVEHPDRRITAMYSASEGVYGSIATVVLVTEQK